jgi:hypothetical protein
MYHRATRNGCPPNPWGTELLRQADTVRLVGKSRTTAYGNVWLDFGLRDVAVFQDIDKRVNFRDPYEREKFLSDYKTWFPGRLFDFHPGGSGKVDLCVFPPHGISNDTMALARLHWG